MSEYLRIMKSHFNNLAHAGSPVSTRALISQVLLGLDEEYNPVVVGIWGKPGISWLDMQFELMFYEKRLEHQNAVKTSSTFNQSVSVNAAFNQNLNGSKPPLKSNFKQQFSGQRGNGGNNIEGNGGNQGRGRRWGNNRLICQVCGKYGHIALVC